MTETNAIVSSPSILAEFTGGSTGEVEMMIGVGIVKDSDAVFFQYMGDDQQPVALVLPNSGKPLTRLSNVTLAGVAVAENVGEFNATKLNVYLRSNTGRTIMLTSGLNTIWSQCVVTSIVGLVNEGLTDATFQLDSWKGTAKLKPCFAAIRVGGAKISDQAMYEALRDARGNRDSAKVELIQRDAIDVITAALGGPVEQSEITIDQEDAAREAGF